MSHPLDGVRIIELAGIGPGPYAGQLLADMGADVIVINRPGPMGAIPNLSNRGKKMLTLDLRKPDGAAVVLDLVRSADVLFEGLRPGVTERGTNMLDGAWPFYRCYMTADKKFMAAGPLEPKFFAEMLRLLEIDSADYGGQMDKTKFAEQRAILEARFASKTREDWTRIFDGSDACVTPILTYDEALSHPQNAARGGLRKQGAFIHPRPAPGFEGMETDPDFTVTGPNEAAEDIFAELGYDAEKVEALKAAGVTP